ncbi:hypothetical protein V8E51_002758 [Hyaloscypha variabilis]
MLNVSTGGRHVFPRISYYFNKVASTYSGRVQIRRLEVERKFLVTLVTVSYLRSNSGGEAKIRTGGDFINSAFIEVNSNNIVKGVIEQNLTISIDGLSIEEILEPCAEFVTERESWIIDGRFKVNVDITDFRHIVREVELTRTLRSANSEHSKEEEEREKLKQEMDHDIKAFIQSYPQAFPAGRPLGKLSAYFRWIRGRM